MNFTLVECTDMVLFYVVHDLEQPPLLNICEQLQIATKGIAPEKQNPFKINCPVPLIFGVYQSFRNGFLMKTVVVL